MKGEEEKKKRGEYPPQRALALSGGFLLRELCVSLVSIVARLATEE